MKKIFLILLFIFPFLVTSSIYSLDKTTFLCPIKYQGDLAVRCDPRGDGTFASPRSGGRAHRGIDLSADLGTPVYAVKTGRVISAQSNAGMGKYVVIRHSGNLITLYGHLQAMYVKKGDHVRQGRIIGRVGKTGNARFRGIDPHLHFEVRYKGVPCDPMQYL